MIAVLQRVLNAQVEVDGRTVASIGHGLLVLLGVACQDTAQDAEYLADKVCSLRIFEDDAGRMNRSLVEVGGGLLVVSQFTLLGDTRKGRRPSFDAAAQPETAQPLYEHFVECCRRHVPCVKTGIFQAHMHVSLVNDGPVTVLCQSKNAGL